MKWEAARLGDSETVRTSVGNIVVSGASRSRDDTGPYLYTALVFGCKLKRMSASKEDMKRSAVITARALLNKALVELE